MTMNNTFPPDDKECARNAKTPEVADIVREAVDILGDAAENVQNEVKEYKDSFIEYVKEEPVKAVGFAFLAGVVLTVLLRD